MKYTRHFFFLIFTFAFLLSACATPDITAEDLVGVWQTEDFEEFLMSWEEEFLAAEAQGYTAIAGPREVYITADGNFYIFLITGASNGLSTSIFHYHYEIVENQLILTSADETAFYPPISFGVWGTHFSPTRRSRGEASLRRDGQLRFVIQDSWRVSHSVSRVSEELPFGWTEMDREEIQTSNEWAREEILAFAQTFGEVLALPVLPYAGDTRISDAVFVFQHLLPFEIEGELVQIAFTGTLPTPTLPQRHICFLSFWRPEVTEFHAIRSANGQFALLFAEESAIPAQWLDVFAAFAF